MLSLRPRRPTLSSGSKVNVKVDFSNLSDFNGWSVKGPNKNIGKVRVTAVTLSMSSSFFLSGNTLIAYISGMQRPISTKLGQRDHSHLPFMSPNFDGVKGHVGVKRSNLWFSRKTFQLTYVTRFFHENWPHESSWHSPQKLWGKKKLRGQMGSRGQVKRSNFQLCPISTNEVSNCSSWSKD